MSWVVKLIRPDFWIVLGIFFIWKLITLTSLVIFSNFFLIFSTDKFLGGTYKNYLLLPEFFSWANFDGEHFISIATNGYQSLQYAFFPLFPKLIGVLSAPFIYNDFTGYFYPIFFGLLISNLFFLLSLLIFYDLMKFDYSKNVAMLSIIALILFPTSFFFGAVYSESLFLFLTLASFYFARRNMWLLASIFGFFSVLTRVFGVLIFFAFSPSLFKDRKKIFWIFLIPLGLVLYMIYLTVAVKDPLSFYSQQLIVGEQHQEGLVTFPQVIFRYIKIIFSMENFNLLYQTIFLELGVAMLFVFLSIIGFIKKINRSYVIFLVLGFLLPTIQGSFSSLPRYVIVLFPGFIVVALVLTKVPKFWRVVYFIISGALLFWESGLFYRGYWVS